VAQIFRCNSSADGRLDVYDGMADSRIGAAYTGLADLLLPTQRTLRSWCGHGAPLPG
jgi:hypothetical protein